LAGGAVAGVIAGAVATVGALGYFVEQGLFDFNAQANSFQKGAYTPTVMPKLRYVEPPPSNNFQDTLDYFQRKDEAQAEYQKALADYNANLSSSNP
jgi:hypothetical protein